MNRWALAALVLSSGAMLACSRSDEAAQRAALQSSGEVVATRNGDSAAVRVRWIDDPNIIALASLLNTRIKAAADYELQAWGSDTTRVFAADMWREHSAIRYSIDSLASALGIVPVQPALAVDVDTATRRHLDVLMAASGGRPLDRAYVNQQIASHELMLDYVTKFAAAAEHSEVRTLMDAIKVKLNGHLARGRALKAEYARADSTKAAADSVRRARARQRSSVRER